MCLIWAFLNIYLLKLYVAHLNIKQLLISNFHHRIGWHFLFGGESSDKMGIKLYETYFNLKPHSHLCLKTPDLCDSIITGQAPSDKYFLKGKSSTITPPIAVDFSVD